MVLANPSYDFVVTLHIAILPRYNSRHAPHSPVSGHPSCTCGDLIDQEKGWPEPYIHGVCTVFLAGKLHNIRSYTAYTYGPGQL